jgi:hypothetical protein
MFVQEMTIVTTEDTSVVPIGGEESINKLHIFVVLQVATRDIWPGHLSRKRDCGPDPLLLPKSPEIEINELACCSSTFARMRMAILLCCPANLLSSYVNAETTAGDIDPDWTPSQPAVVIHVSLPPYATLFPLNLTLGWTGVIGPGGLGIRKLNAVADGSACATYISK